MLLQRDLKPGNILLASSGAHVCAKIADFGFACALAPARLAQTMCGSPLYMAPEVLFEQQYDARADLWSVGVLLFEMLVGHVPFSGNNIGHLKKVIDTNEAFLPFDMRDRLSPACQVRLTSCYCSMLHLLMLCMSEQCAPVHACAMNKMAHLSTGMALALIFNAQAAVYFSRLDQLG